MAPNAFTVIEDGEPWFVHVPTSKPAAVGFDVPKHFDVGRRSLLYYTVSNKVTYRYTVRVNGTLVTDGADVGPDGEHRASWSVPAGALQVGKNDLVIEAQAAGDVHFSNMSAWLHLPGTNIVEQMSISDGGVTLSVSHPPAIRQFPFALPDVVDVGADAAVEFTIRQEQPRLRYRMHVNAGAVEASRLQPPGQSYDVFEIIQAQPFTSGANRLLIQVEYGGSHIHFSELLAWWQHR